MLYFGNDHIFNLTIESDGGMNTSLDTSMEASECEELELLSSPLDPNADLHGRAAPAAPCPAIPAPRPQSVAQERPVSSSKPPAKPAPLPGAPPQPVGAYLQPAKCEIAIKTTPAPFPHTQVPARPLSSSAAPVAVYSVGNFNTSARALVAKVCCLLALYSFDCSQ
jgi:hypothetical protein